MRSGAPLFIALLALLLLVGATPGGKQHGDALGLKVTLLMRQLDAYDTLSPFTEGDYDLIVTLQSKIIGCLLEVLNDPHLTPDDLKLLSNAHGLGTARSRDGRVRSFSIDEKTGGTFRSNLSVMRYTLRDDRVIAETLGDTEDGDGLSASTFYAIHDLDTIGHRYLAMANVVTCGTCIADYAVELTLDSAVQWKTIEQFEGRGYNSLVFDFDPATRSILYDNFEEGIDTAMGVPMQRRFTGRWQDNGSEFVLIEACERLEPVKADRLMIA